ncbi:MAG: hypothetical protein GX070_04225 [Alcaligenaceae bacterium]|nr:hypothetical protein [Alcaligenaceae bacterium]
MIASLPELTFDELVACDTRELLVLTVNNRLALRLKQNLITHLGMAAQILDLPAIMPLNRWLGTLNEARLFEGQGHVATVVLDRFAEQLVWESVIEQEEGRGRLLDLQQTAKLASDASHLCADWHITVQDSESTQEYEHYQQWQMAYRERLQKLDAEDDSLMQENLIQLLENKTMAGLPQQIVLLGFNELSPRFGRLLKACQGNGCEVSVLQEEAPPASDVMKSSWGDTTAEWEAAIYWAQQKLQENPGGSFAIVAPDLEEKAPLARRLLTRILSAQGMAWNMAVGRPLTEWSLPRAAFAWLKLLAQLGSRQQCEVQVLGAALLAGHCAASATELAAMAQHDVRLRQQEDIHLGDSEVFALFDKIASDFSLKFKQVHEKWCQPFQNGSRRAGSDQWAQRIRECLFELGFPGGASLSSANFQVCQAFEKLLVQFSGLYAAGGLLDGFAACSLLYRVGMQMPFQPQRDKHARLDVLGFLEAEGGRWDAIWVVGLTDEILPANPKPNPLLPVSCLRRVNAPRATPEREKAWADEMFRALLQCAPQVRLSWPMMDGEKELRASALLEAIALAEPAGFTHDTAFKLNTHDREIETLIDNKAPPVARGRAIKGGMDVLETQARNPLWAFARYRLGARALDDYPTAVSQRVRGIFLHKVMELIWQMLGNWERLAEKAEDGSISGLIEECVELAARQELKHEHVKLMEMEKERANHIVTGFLQMEFDRVPFHIRQLEKDVKWQRASVQLSLRMDRIDALEDGQQVIIDYKSGAVPAFKNDWSRPVPINLQLPFYASVMASAENSPVAGLLFARLNARKIELKGIANEDLGVDKLDDRSDWDTNLAWNELLQRWKAVIEQLADDFSNGVADNRAYRQSDLEYCDVKAFLRLEQESGNE